MAKIFQKPKLILVLILFLSAFLRLWKITEVPVSLFGDELDVGYHAYSIYKTGRDYYGNFLPLHFHSIAEWRTPLYLYSAVPSVALFGITPLGVRLPAAIFGIIGVWGMYLVTKEILKFSNFEKLLTLKNLRLELLTSFLLAVSSWHIQYSRAAFEVTELLAFLIFGFYFFFKSFEKPKYLWISVTLLAFTPWIYSTAKLFTPLLVIFLFLVWRGAILKMPKVEIAKAIFAGCLVALPIFYSTFFGQGAQRAIYTSVFTDPAIESEVGIARMADNIIRGGLVEGYKPSFWDRFFHNKLVFWTDKIVKNYFQSLSFSFLFAEGDPNLRHSIKGMGQFYRVEIIGLILGAFFFFVSKIDRKVKALFAFWILVGILPAALTRDGGNHATRLILILPPLIFLISYGILEATLRLRSRLKNIFLASYFLALTTNFIFYQHTYWIHNPWDSERWWHAGFKEAIQSIKEVEEYYDKVIISMAGEPAWIFFAGWYQYPPEKWQKNFPLENVVELKGFGKVSHIEKFYFGNFNVSGESLYDLPKYIDPKTLYLSVAKEISVDLIQEPERVPPGLKLVKAIPYPSGEPAFYLFTKSL